MADRLLTAQHALLRGGAEDLADRLAQCGLLAEEGRRLTRCGRVSSEGEEEGLYYAAAILSQRNRVFAAVLRRRRRMLEALRSATACGGVYVPVDDRMRKRSC